MQLAPSLQTVFSVGWHWCHCETWLGVQSFSTIGKYVWMKAGDAVEEEAATPHLVTTWNMIFAVTLDIGSAFLRGKNSAWHPLFPEHLHVDVNTCQSMTLELNPETPVDINGAWLIRTLKYGRAQPWVTKPRGKCSHEDKFGGGKGSSLTANLYMYPPLLQCNSENGT